MGQNITASFTNRTDLDLIDENIFAFCWVVDYPMFEKDEQTNKIGFSQKDSICHP